MDQYILGQSKTKYLTEKTNEIRLDLCLKPNKWYNNINIFGMIYDSNSNPIKDCKVIFCSSKNKELKSAYTTEHGLYSIDKINLGTEGFISAIKDGYKIAHTKKICCCYPKVEVNFEMDSFTMDKYTVSGHLTDKNYKPVNNILITLFYKNKENRLSHCQNIFSNYFGQFVFDNLKEGDYLLLINDPQYTGIEDNITINKLSDQIISVNYVLKRNHQHYKDWK